MAGDIASSETNLKLHIHGGNDKHGNCVGQYVCYLQGVDGAVYNHPCVLYRGQDLYGMLLAGNNLALRVPCKRCGRGWPKSLLKIHTFVC